MEKERIELVIGCIEEHLAEEWSNARLAEIAGYSEFHFLRAFRRHVGLTPAAYIRKRRISEIVRRIGQEDRPMADIAFDMGFNSKENFTRAFLREHRILPSAFRSAGCSLRLFAPFSFDRADPAPAVSMLHMQPFALVVYPCDETIPSSFWNRYNAEGRSARLTGGRTVPDWGVMRWNADRSMMDYFIGVRAEDAQGDLTGTVRLEAEGGLYAVFDTPKATQHNFVTTINRTWDWIYDVWLPASGYRRAAGLEMECYTESSRTYTERIFVPLERKDQDG